VADENPYGVFEIRQSPIDINKVTVWCVRCDKELYSYRGVILSVAFLMDELNNHEHVIPKLEYDELMHQFVARGDALMKMYTKNRRLKDYIYSLIAVYHGSMHSYQGDWRLCQDHKLCAEAWLIASGKDDLKDG
jgi:hypothetical protein